MWEEFKIILKQKSCASLTIAKTLNYDNYFVSVIFVSNMTGLCTVSFWFWGQRDYLTFKQTSLALLQQSQAYKKTSVWQCQIDRDPWLRSKQTSVGLTGNNAVPSWTNASLHTSKHTEVNFKASAIINKSNLLTSGAFSSKYTRE